jgi:hypothetical protein
MVTWLRLECWLGWQTLCHSSKFVRQLMYESPNLASENRGLPVMLCPLLSNGCCCRHLAAKRTNLLCKARTAYKTYYSRCYEQTWLDTSQRFRESYCLHDQGDIVELHGAASPASTPHHQANLPNIRSILIPSSHLCLSLPSGLFPSGFPTKTLHTFLSSLMPRPPHSPWLDLTCNFFIPLLHHSPSVQTFHSEPCSQTLSLC